MTEAPGPVTRPLLHLRHPRAAAVRRSAPPNPTSHRIDRMPPIATVARPLSLAWTLLVAGALAACVHAPGSVATGQSPLDDAGQLVLVTTDGWDADRGTLRRYQRRAGAWTQVGPAAPVTVGRAGVAWGAGLHAPVAGTRGPTKREGDGRAPAGIFAIGTAFGYADSAATALPYAPMQAQHYCIDVPASPLYNRIVDAADEGPAAVAGSTEPMRRDLHAGGDQRYRLGFVIQHNPQATPAAGSCIFAHLWKSPGDATAGCTAMAPATMDALLAWLDPARNPRFVLLPLAEQQRLHATWGLPAPAPDAASLRAPATTPVSLAEPRS